MSIKATTTRACLFAMSVTFIASQGAAGGLSVIIEPSPQDVEAERPATNWTGGYLGGHVSLPKVDASVLEDIGDGISIGAHGGYLLDLGQLVVGAELDVNLTAIESWSDDFPLSTIAAAKLKAGYDAGDFLPYIGFGVSQARLAGDVDETDNGSFASVGIDYRLTNNVSIGAEYAHYRYDDFAGTGEDFDVSATGAKISYRF